MDKAKLMFSQPQAHGLPATAVNNKKTQIGINKARQNNKKKLLLNFMISF